MIKKIPNHFVVASSAWASKVITALLQLYLVRILLIILGNDNYALFAVLTGLMGWFALADLGIGISLQNQISELKSNNKEYRDVVGSVLLIYFVMMLLAMFLFYFVSNYFSKIILKEFIFIDESKRNLLFFITGELFIVMNFSSVIYRIWYAEFKGYISNLLPMIGYILSSFGIYVLSKLKGKNDDILLLCVIIFLLPNTLISFIFMMKKLYFSRVFWYRYFDKRIVFRVFSKGFRFWFFSLMASGVLQIDYLIMARYLSYDEIVLYNIVMKVFIFIFFIYNSLLTALWPEFSVEIHRKNISKVKNYVKKYLLIGILYIFISTLIFIMFKRNIMKIIVPNNSVEFSNYLLIVFGFYYLIRVWTDTYAMVLQSVSILKPFWILVPIQALISLVGQIYFVQIYRLNGILYGLILSFLLTVTWGLPYYTKKYIFKRGLDVN